jgi:tetratricopeptide (TPR) repeat protein
MVLGRHQDAARLLKLARDQSVQTLEDGQRRFADRLDALMAARVQLRWDLVYDIGRELIDICEHFGAKDYPAVFETNVGSAARALFRHGEAAQYLERAIDRSRKQGDAGALMEALLEAAVNARDSENHELGEALLQEAHILALQREDSEMQTSVQHDEGLYAMQLGDFGRAKECFAEVLRIDARAFNGNRSSLALYELGRVACYEQNWLEGEDYMRRAIELMQSGQYAPMLPLAYDMLGDILNGAGKRRAAQGCYRRADAIRSQER